MMQGILCADPKQAASITANAFRRGLIIERAGPEDEVIKCLMPLTTSYDILDEGLDILESAIAGEFAQSAGVPRAARSTVAGAVHSGSFQNGTLEQAC